MIEYDFAKCEDVCMSCNRQATVSVGIWKEAGLEFRITLCQVCADDMADGLREEE